MNIKCYLAMTASELSTVSEHPIQTAYMSCHFSGSNRGLSNLPVLLPPRSMVIVDDLIPPQNHDQILIAEQLSQLTREHDVSCFLLDLQRPDIPENQEIASFLSSILPCPVGVSSLYARGLSCPVFLPPPPLHTSLKKHLQGWEGRQLWLEIAEESARIEVTEHESTYSPLAHDSSLQPSFTEDALCCRYNIKIQEDRACFTLCRNKEMLLKLLQQADDLCIQYAIGPYQQLYPFP